MRGLIHVKPVRELRREFARWAVEQRAKVRTVSESAFGVPEELFPLVPEALLVGALVDGQPYVAARPREAEPGETPQQLPAEPAESVEASGEVLGEHVCGDCGRSFDTPRGVAAHRRQAHSDETGE